MMSRFPTAIRNMGTMEDRERNSTLKPRRGPGLAAMGLLAIAVMSVGLFPVPAPAAAVPGDPPLAVRFVLRDVEGLMGKKAYDKAIARLNAFQGESEKSRHPLIDLALGNLFLLKEDPGRAKAPLRRAAAAMPDRIDAWLNLAKACYDTGEYSGAADCFTTAYERSAEAEKDPQHLYFAAVSRMLAKSNSEAVATFERLFAAHAKQIQPEWRENFVQVLMAAEKPRRALPLVRELALQSTGKTRSKWQEMLLHLYLQLEMTNEARACARQMTEEYPGEARWWKALAHVELSSARYKEALAALTIYGWLQPLTDSEKNLWADLNLQLEIPDRAAPVYAELLARAPDRKLLEKLVSAYHQKARYDEALATLDRYATDRDDPKLMMLRADLLYNARRFSDAANAYRRAALKGSPQAGQAWLMAGYAAWQGNDLDTSRQSFERATGYSRQKKAAQAAMRQLAAFVKSSKADS